jgi:hypothetical protein
MLVSRSNVEANLVGCRGGWRVNFGQLLVSSYPRTGRKSRPLGSDAEQLDARCFSCHRSHRIVRGEYRFVSRIPKPCHSPTVTRRRRVPVPKRLSQTPRSICITPVESLFYLPSRQTNAYVKRIYASYIYSSCTAYKDESICIAIFILA